MRYLDSRDLNDELDELELRESSDPDALEEDERDRLKVLRELRDEMYHRLARWSHFHP